MFACVDCLTIHEAGGPCAAGTDPEEMPMHKHGDPIPTPNRPDQTPAEQRPEYLLDDEGRLCPCGTPHGQHANGCDELPDQE